MLETQRERVPRNDGGELDTALAFLSFQRACVFKKIEGLDEEQLRRRLVVSDTTLLGLVKHFADGERWWFALLICSAVKGVIVHYGGVRGYRQALPFFMGLVLGQYVVSCIWSIIAVAIETLTAWDLLR